MMTAARTLLGGLIVGLLTVGLALFGGLETIELGALDRLFEWRGPRAPQSPIIIIAIDEAAFQEFGLNWPWPRAMHGQLIDVIGEGRPLAIGVDVMFSEPSIYGAADDEALGRSVGRAGNVVLAAGPERINEETSVGIMVRREFQNMPIPVIRRGATAIGSIGVRPDDDGSLRRFPLRSRIGAETVPNLDVQLYQVAAARGFPVAPLPRGDRIFINFRGGPATFKMLPYHQVFRGEIPRDFFRDKIVLIGPTALNLHDFFSTPFARNATMPGVEIHANALETLLRGNSGREVPRLVSTALALVAALSGAGLVVRLRALRAFVAVLLIWVTLALATFAAFLLWDVWIRSVGVTLALILGYGTAVTDNFVREQREKRRLSQFFSPAVLREIIRHREGARLGSTRRTLTVLFSDIRGFTSMSERLEPEHVVEMLREYLTEMTEVVFRHGGTVDKYIGDCIMALYNVPFEDPNHAANAIRTALELQERALAVSERWEGKLGVKIRNGVGIATGEAVVGTMGSRQRLEYTAIGDVVNLASRLEALTKEHAASIIISESTYEHVKDQFLTRKLDEVAVRGKAQPVKIYGVVAGDARKYRRTELHVAATLTAPSDGRSCRVRTGDIGEGGATLLDVPPEWPTGTRVQIRCEIGSSSKPIAAEGTIVWRRADRAGVMFGGLDPEVASAIVEYVAAQPHR